MSAALNGTTLALSVIAAVFLGISCIGYSKEESVLKDIPWFTASVGEFGDVYAGLHAVDIKIDFSGFKSEQVETWNKDSECGRNGEGAFAMVIIGCVLAAVTAILSGVSICAQTFAVQIASLVSCLISFSTSLVGVGLFMGNCYRSVTEDDDDGDDDTDIDTKWGPGAILAIIGMLLMFIGSALQIAVNCMGVSGYSAPPATAAGTEMSKA